MKRDYRRFKIKDLTGPNDYASMEQVLTRRFQRYLEGDEKFARMPDLLLIDGGKIIHGEVRSQEGVIGVFAAGVSGRAGIICMAENRRLHTGCVYVRVPQTICRYREDCMICA